MKTICVDGEIIEVSDEEAQLPSMPEKDYVLYISQECQRRIFAVADQITQMNLSAIYGAGRMTEPDAAAYTAFLDWKDAMVTHCRALIADPALEPDWPVVPDGVKELADQY